MKSADDKKNGNESANKRGKNVLESLIVCENNNVSVKNVLIFLNRSRCFSIDVWEGTSVTSADVPGVGLEMASVLN